MISSRWPRPIGISASMALMPGLDRRVDALAGDDAGGDPLDRAGLRRRDRALVVERAAQRVHDAARAAPAPTGTSTTRPVVLTVSPSLMRGRVAQDDRADGLLLQVQGHAHDAAGKLEQLGRERALEPVDLGDAVADLDDRADVARLRGRVEVVDRGLDDADDLVGSDGHSVLRSGAGVSWAPATRLARSRASRSPHAGIDESVADADGQPADQLGVDRRRDLDAPLGRGLRCARRRPQARQVRVSWALVTFAMTTPCSRSTIWRELVRDARQDRQPAPPGQQEDQVAGQGAHPGSQQARDDGAAVHPGDRRVVHDRGRGIRADELHGQAKLRQPRVERPVAAGDLAAQPRRSGAPRSSGRPSGGRLVGRAPPAAGPPTADSARNSSTRRRCRSLLIVSPTTRPAASRARSATSARRVGDRPDLLGLDLGRRALAHPLQLLAGRGDVRVALSWASFWARSRISRASRRAALSSADRGRLAGRALDPGLVGVVEALLDPRPALPQRHRDRLEDDEVQHREEDEEVEGRDDDPEQVDGQPAGRGVGLEADDLAGRLPGDRRLPRSDSGSSPT